MKKEIIIGLLSVVMCFALTGCGAEKPNNGEENNTSVQNEQQGEMKSDESKVEPRDGAKSGSKVGISDAEAWPDNKFTKQVPKPEQTFSEEAMTDDVTCYLYPSWTVEQAKSYAQALVSNGYALSSTYIDDDKDYMVVYKNADGSYQVTLVAGEAETDGRIAVAIPLDRR